MNDLQSQLHDIRPIIPLNDLPPWWVWLLAGILLCTLVASLLWWRRRKQKPRETVEPTLTAFEWFEEAMAKLQTLKSEPVEYLASMSFVFREYIERRYQFPATDRTSEEILVELRRLYLFSDSEMKDIRKLFGIVDPVKYAARRPVADDVQWAQECVYSLAKNHRMHEEAS